MDASQLNPEDESGVVVPNSPLPVRFGIRGEMQRFPRSVPMVLNPPADQNSPMPSTSWSQDQSQPLDFSTTKCCAPARNGDNSPSPVVPKEEEREEDDEDEEEEQYMNFANWVTNGYSQKHRTSKSPVVPPTCPQTSNLMNLYGSMIGIPNYPAPISSPATSITPVQPLPTEVNNPEVPNNSTPTNTNRNKRSVRPFKAFPRDPFNYLSMGISLSTKSGLAYGVSEEEAILVHQSNNEYIDFREKMLHTTQTARHKVQSRSTAPVTIPQSTASSTTTTPAAATTTAETTTITTTSTTSSAVTDEATTSTASTEEASNVAPTSPTSSTSSQGPTRKKSRNLPEELKDEAYWERRRKNNEAAKRSRDARRAKEDEIAIRCAYLEQENVRLRVEVAAARSEITKLRCIFFNT